MTTDRRFERDLPELFAQLAPAVMPDYRDDVVQQTARTRQRPAWMFPERWLPVDITLTPARGRPRTVAAALAFVIVGLLVAATLIAYVGSRSRVPAPFGPAANGALYYSSGGDIYRVDTVTGTPTAIIAGQAADVSVLPSRDGRRLAVMRAVARGTQIVVTDQDGANPRTLAGTYDAFSEIDWSPTDDQIAVVSTVGLTPSISIIPIDGSSARTLDLGMEAHNIWYLPDGRLLFKGTTMHLGGKMYALYLVDPAGTTAPRAITTQTAEEGMWIDPYPSPDGRSVIFHRWVGAEQGHLRVLDIASGTDTPVVIPTGVAEDEGASLSPDGTQVLFTRFGQTDNTLAVVPRTGGPVVEIGERTPGNDMAVAGFSPDGRSVIAFYPDTKHLWLLDPTGTTKGQMLTLPVNDVPTWQRLAP